MKIRLYTAILALSLTLLVASCDRDPVTPPEPEIEYITIADLRDMYTGGTADTIKGDVYIQGFITLTPELGNLPAQIAYIQDSTDAICLVINSDETNTLAMNSEIKILCYQGILSKYNGLLQFSNLSITNQVQTVSLIAEMPEPETVTIAQLLTGEYESRYVYVPGVQFSATGTFSGTKYLTDCMSEVAVYTRSGATFASTAMPTGNGSLKGISSIYNSQQILLRDPAELDMTGDRCGEASSTYYEQDFQTLTTNYTNVSALPGWLTISQAGTKTWFSYKVSTNYFIETTAYNSGQTSVITWMIAPPVDLTDAVMPFMTFESADGYDNGATLKLYASTDYDGSASPWDFTWTELSFNRPPSTTSGYSAFTSSGLIYLTAYKGQTVYLAWVYTGADNTGTADDDTTTWEIDNIVIAEE